MTLAEEGNIAEESLVGEHFIRLR